MLPYGVIELLEYVNAAGVSPFAKWREKLDATTRARVTVAVLRLETGNFSAAKGAGARIFELRLDFGPGYRVYFGKDGEQWVILLGDGTKKRQQADIKRFSYWCRGAARRSVILSEAKDLGISEENQCPDSSLRSE